MRVIGTIPNEEQARTFESFLLTQDVQAQIDEEADGWAVWIHDEDHVERAKDLLAEFLETPDDPRYEGALAEADRKRRETKKLEEQARKNVVDVRQRWNRGAASTVPVTYGLIGVSVLVVMACTDWTSPFDLCDRTEPLLSHLFIAPVSDDGNGLFWQPERGLEAIRQGQVWRLVTPIFIHFGPLHILFNMLWTRDLGAMIETRRGSRRFLALVLAIAVLSNLGQFYLGGFFEFGKLSPSSSGPSPFFGGMSGVVYGLFGYVWMKSKYDHGSGFYLHPNLVFWMMAFFVICLAGFFPRVANTAHGVGLAVGIVIGYAPVALRRFR